MRGASRARLEHRPGFLKIKGSCRWRKRMGNILLGADAVACVTGILSHMMGSIRAYVDQDNMHGVVVSRVLC